MTKTYALDKIIFDADNHLRKVIEFRKLLNNKREWEPTTYTSSDFKAVILICDKYCWQRSDAGIMEFDDIILAYDENPMNGNIFLGSWNGGVVK